MGCTNYASVQRNTHMINTNQNPFENSSILSNLSPKSRKAVFQLIQQLSQRIQYPSLYFQLAFRASEYKMQSQQFHRKCHLMDETVIFILTENNLIYGGYTPCQWKNEEYLSYQKDEKGTSFLFKFDQEKDLQVFKLKRGCQENAIMNDQQCGPVFGQGHDLHVSDLADEKDNWNNIGKSYDCHHAFGSNKANSLLSGSSLFTIKQYEVWKISDFSNYKSKRKSRKSSNKQ